MSADPEKAKAALIQRVAAIVLEELPAEAAARVERFVRLYYERVAPEDVMERDPIDLYGAALAHWELARQRVPGGPKIRVYNPEFESDGWQSTHTVIELVNDDMPFLVDSVASELSRHRLGIHIVVHPVMLVRRDGAGTLIEILDEEERRAEGALTESMIHVEVDRQTDPRLLGKLGEHLRRILSDVRAAVEDWQKMREQVGRIIAELDEHPPPVDEEEIEEAKAFLRWVHDDHFTFLGFREYELLEVEGEETLRATLGSGLGILRPHGPKPSSTSFAKLPAEVRALARERKLLVLTKANSRATVHRPTYMDYVGVKRFDASGQAVGEWRFLGLYTSTAYHQSPLQIPVLRHKVRRALETAGFQPGSHSHKDLEAILDGFPRDELFQITSDELHRIAMGILHLQERQRVRLFVRRDLYGRFVSCIVYLPRDRYNTDARERIQNILLEDLGGTGLEYSTHLSESVLARLHFIVHIAPGQVHEYDVGEIEARLAIAVRSWSDELRDALVDELGEEHGMSLYETYGEAFPAGYRADTLPRRAVADIKRLEALKPEKDLGMSLYHLLEAPAGFLRFKLYRSGTPITLSEILPLLEHMGVEVVDQHPYEIRLPSGAPRWIYDLGLSYGHIDALEADRVKTIFQETFSHAWDGDIEDDRFNRLTLRARLTWRDVMVLRAYSKYLRQIGSRFSQRYVEDAIAANPHIAGMLVELFHTRFDPARGSNSDKAANEIAEDIEAALDAVESLDQDRILRSFLGLIEATTRTNYFQSGPQGGPKSHLAFKFDTRRLADLPLPRPEFEIFVYSPRTEGVHLRRGHVARGGIRWSDRPEDFRTEILGLVKAQQVKNAIIVPVGAKGGFFVKRPPTEDDRAALMQEVQACYRTFIGGLLDLTDNLVDAEVVPPPNVVRRDGDDTYLVVAADKGTAAFSDIANEISGAYGFWLGDAFASGGSVGYDHKKMGITARGAWESVKRHFRELGVDIQTTDFTVVGIGDMSGDVFGNGMLLSPHIKLIGAFDHRHIFIDPNPDPEVSFKERERLFRTPGSSWADYDESAISPGGGVFRRTAKSIRLSEQARKALGTTDTSPTPTEVVKAILKAKVDLLWNGGIGTFVKARDESHADAGDKANDQVRADAHELRCRVVGEGGNLGLTQRARIEFALAGGRINTDFIDNSAGVDCSDHEVNIKILLDAIVAQGDMTEKQRNKLLTDMTEEVSDLVLRDNYDQAQAISNAAAQTHSMVDVHARYMRTLEQAEVLDRALEFLPVAEDLEERASKAQGLTTPELAVLLAYSKLTIKKELLASDVPEDPYLSGELERYFPSRLGDRFREAMHSHPLRREIISNRIANEMVNMSGITFAFRLGEETGVTPADIARAHTVAREVFDIAGLWAEIESLDNQIQAGVQTSMILEGRKLLERATRWLLRHCSRPLDISAQVARYGHGVRDLSGAMPHLLVGQDHESLLRAADSFVEAGVHSNLAMRVASLNPLVAALDIVEVADAVGQQVESAAGVHFMLGAHLQLHWLRDRILALPRSDRWQTLARDALRNELYTWHSALTAEVLQATEPELEPEGRIKAWLTSNGRALGRCEHMLDEIRTGGVFDLATLSVALREVGTLVEAGRVPIRARRTGA